MKKIILILSFIFILFGISFATPLGQGLGNIFSDKAKITIEGGYAIKLTNKTGATTIKGYLVTNSTETGNAFMYAQVDSPDSIGVVYEGGIADGEEAYVVVAGIADVYYSTNTVLGYYARNMVNTDDNDTNGHAIAEAVPTAPFSTDKHFQEVGHLLEAIIGAGLAKTILHFN